MDPIVVELIGLVKALLWPSVAVYFINRFHPQIRELLPRLRKGPGGLGFDPPPQGSVPPPNEPGAELERLPLPESPVVAKQMQTIRDDPRLAALTDSQAREQALIQALAESQMTAFFERIHGTIWASQMALLRRLNAGPQGDTAENLRYFYDAAAAVWPTMFETYPFEQYLGFLSASMLATPEEDRVVITDLGRDYLKHVATAGLLEPSQG